MNDGFFMAIGALFVGLVGFLAVVAYILPGLTRPDLYFAVTVDPAFRRTPPGRHILSHYRVQILAHTLIAFTICIVAAIEAPRAMVAGIFYMAGGAIAAFLRARRNVMPHAMKPAPVREIELTFTPEALPGGWLMQAVPFTLLACVAAYLALHWGQIPDRFPIHWDINGNINGWATRSPGGVYFPLVMGGVLAALFALMAREIFHGTRHIHATGTLAANEARFRRAMVWISVTFEYFMALLFAWVGLIPLREQTPGGPVGEAKAVLFITLALAVGVVAAMAHLGQGGSRLARANAPAECEPAGDRTDDRSWKAGMIYVNRDDPAILVEKRFGMGYTLNFGHPVTWLILGGLILLAILAPLLATRFSH